jgi:predicted MPP superfamily phosphohydrolase
MKIAVIPDQHQRSYWKKIIPRINEFDKIVFLGDYFDDWNNKWLHQMNNFLNIINFKKEFKDKIDLLWGNHETSYYIDERCSGYQEYNAIYIEKTLNDNKDLLKVISVYDNWIFAHGGVSKFWMRLAGVKNVSKINQLFIEKPDYFRWVGPCSYGDNHNESPLWIRPESLMNYAVKNYHFCVGHTEYLKPKKLTNDGQIFVFCDTKHHNYLTVIDTKKPKISHEILVPRNS